MLIFTNTIQKFTHILQYCPVMTSVSYTHLVFLKQRSEPLCQQKAAVKLLLACSAPVSYTHLAAFAWTHQICDCIVWAGLRAFAAFFTQLCIDYRLVFFNGDGFEVTSLCTFTAVSYTHLDVYKRQDHPLTTGQAVYCRHALCKTA